MAAGKRSGYDRGVGNCASALVQGITFYRDASEDTAVPGLMHVRLGGYHVADIEFSAAFDVAQGKVGRDLAEAITAAPNNTIRFADVPSWASRSGAGRRWTASAAICARRSPKHPSTMSRALARDRHGRSRLLPARGLAEATCWYAEQALKAGCAFVNCIPVFIASREEWRRFEDARLPVIGDDIKSQVGATIVHRVLAGLFRERGVRLDRTYQLNFGGNTDFLNMLERERLDRKSCRRRGR